MEHPDDEFLRCLDSHCTATLALNDWCNRHGLPGADRVHAEVLQDEPIDPAAYTGRLVVAPGETLRHRRVRLNWGAMTLSEADNWYLPQRLPPAMRERLENSSVPFGQVVMSLGPQRTDETRERVDATDADDHRFFLHVTALLYTAQGAAIAEVSERYRRELLG